MIALDRYGQVYTLDSELTFVPGETDGHLVLRIRKSGTNVATLHYYVEFFPVEK
jgi:hypothetical protein